MFFIFGIQSGQKELNYNELVICEHCGSYGRYQVFMTYMCLSLFFIPVLKWGKRYYVKMSCCSALYELNYETGRQIARGESVEIKSSDLKLPREGNRLNPRWDSEETMTKRCGNCGYVTKEDFEYCPKCGQRF